MKKVTADDLVQRADELTRPVQRVWYQAHPHGDAIIAALKRTTKVKGVLAALREAGDKTTTLGMLSKLRGRIKRGEL